MGLHVTGGEAFQEKLKQLMAKSGKDLALRVGFLEGATYPDGTSVAQVAALNEYGHGIPVGKRGMGPQARVPARPFFQGMLDKKSPSWRNRIVNLWKHYEGDMTKVMQALGQTIAEDLQTAIIEFNEPPDKAITIKRKGFKGGAQATLQDTKVMLNAVAYEVNGERFATGGSK
jgi:hypothetical protein